MNWIWLCGLGYVLAVLVFWRGAARLAGRAEHWTEEIMKGCEACGKHTSGPLKPTLMMGPKGFRTYQACPVCQIKAQGKPKKAVQDDKRV